MSLGGSSGPKSRVETSGRIEAHLRNRQFLTAYREARELWIAGAQSLFPIGTYWLRRFAQVPISAY